MFFSCVKVIQMLLVLFRRLDEILPRIEAQVWGFAASPQNSQPDNRL